MPASVSQDRKSHGTSAPTTAFGRGCRGGNGAREPSSPKPAIGDIVNCTQRAGPAPGRLGGRCLDPPLSSSGVYPNRNRADCENRDQHTQCSERVHLFVRNRFVCKRTEGGPLAATAFGRTDRNKLARGHIISETDRRRILWSVPNGPGWPWGDSAADCRSTLH